MFANILFSISVISRHSDDDDDDDNDDWAAVE